jgi:predicted secreted Zn-dependent protease
MHYLFTILLLCLTCVPDAQAQPNVVKNIEYYDVSGSDTPTIRKQMDTKGPKDRNSGRQVWAHTHWHIKWKFNYSAKNLNCLITSVRTDVTINFVVPRWVDRGDASDYVKNKWTSFFTALKKHEQKHAMHGIQAAREIEATIPKLPKRRLCQQIKEDAQSKAREIVKKYSDMDIKYDAETKHGRIEGVVF